MVGTAPMLGILRHKIEQDPWETALLESSTAPGDLTWGQLLSLFTACGQPLLVTSWVCGPWALTWVPTAEPLAPIKYPYP